MLYRLLYIYYHELFAVYQEEKVMILGRTDAHMMQDTDNNNMLLRMVLYKKSPHWCLLGNISGIFDRRSAIFNTYLN